MLVGHAKSGGRLYLFILPALILFVATYGIPVGRMVLLSFYDSGWTFRQYVRVFSDPFVIRTLANTVRLAVEVTLVCLLLGYPVAYLMVRSRPRIRNVIAILITLPMWTSLLVRAYVWMVLLGRQGLVNAALQAFGLTAAPLPLLYNRFSVSVGMVHVMLPFMIFPLFSVMRRINVNLVSAAHGLGARPSVAFLWIFMPLTLPGVAAGTLLVFILSLGFFVTPALLGGLKDVTYVMLVEMQVNELLHWELASAMAVVLLVVTLGLVILYQRILGFGGTAPWMGYAPMGGKWLARVPAVGIALASRVIFRLVDRWSLSRPQSWQNNSGPETGFDWRATTARRLQSWIGLLKGRLRVPLVHVMAWGVIVFLVLPITLFFPLAFSASPYMEFPPRGLSLQWFRNYFSRADWVAPTLVSLKVAVLTTVVATLIGTLAAIGLVRGNFKGRTAFTAFLISPMVVPTIIVAIALYFQFARLHLIGSTIGLVLGHLILAVPMVIIVMMGALRSVDDSLERAAMTLGAGRVKAFLRVTLPLIRPSVLTAVFFAFLASFDDVVIALFLSGTRAATLPKRMWDGIRFEVDATIAAASTLMLALPILLLAITEIVRVRAQRRRRPVEPP